MAKIKKRENLNQLVYNELKKMIRENHFKPGERINVEKLTKVLGISRTPIWEAMRRLEQENLVVNVVNKGIYLSTLSTEEALGLLEIRKVLEGMAVSLAAKYVDQVTIDNLKLSIERQKEVVENDDIPGYITEDNYFHTQIHKASKNIYLAQLLENLESKLHPIAPNELGFYKLFIEEHIAIISSLENHDEESAKKYFNIHNQHVIEIIRKGDLTYIRPESAISF